MNSKQEYGHELWPPSFQNLSSSQQVRMATNLCRQDKYLKKRPFHHVGGKAKALQERLMKKNTGEFCWALSFDPTMIALLCREGFLPMAGQIFADLICLLPKLHTQRSMMVDIMGLKIDNGARKKAKRYSFTVDRAMDQVIKGCQTQHGSNCWFYGPLVEAYRCIHRQNDTGGLEGVRIHSCEVWDKKTGLLVAGELGYACGGIYTSLSGYREPGSKSAGTVQCCCTAILLKQLGFKVWDLGMPMEYKKKLGSCEIPRADFLQHVYSARDMKEVVLSCGSETCCGELVKWFLSQKKEKQEKENKVKVTGGEGGK
jgi:Leu/Phe-tRNA-protein transferase